MVTLRRPVQPENAHSPILVTLSGMMMLLRLVQFRNAHLSMLVTLSGMVRLATNTLLRYRSAPQTSGFEVAPYW